ncbi:hypothetical protein DQM20_13650, partial [Lactiplantibacillus plantarum]
SVKLSVFSIFKLLLFIQLDIKLVNYFKPYVLIYLMAIVNKVSVWYLFQFLSISEMRFDPMKYR